MLRNKKIYWIFGILSAILGLIVTEGSMIVTTKMFGVMKATLIRVAFTIPLSWLAIFLCAGTNTSAKVRAWFAGKKASLSRKAQLAMTGGKFLVIVNTAVFLGPILASILRVRVGAHGKRLYFYAALCALLSAWVWSCFYGSVCWGFGKIF